MTLQEFLEYSGQEPKKYKDGYILKCPAHMDDNGSLHVRERDGLILCKCFAGCEFDEILRAFRLRAIDLRIDGGKSYDNSGEDRIVATYDYTDADGNLLYQAVRYHPKRFSQRTPDGKGGWVNSVDKSLHVLYRLPQLLKAIKSGEDIYIVGGEKDVEAIELIGLTATCNSGGERDGWSPQLFENIRGAKRVFIVRDRDGAGYKFAKNLCRKLAKYVDEVVVVEAAVGKDSHDHIMAGYTARDFLEVNPFEFPGVDSKLPIIETNRRELRDIGSDALRAIEAANKRIPQYFALGSGILCSIGRNSRGGACILPHSASSVESVLAKVANWISSQESQKPGKRPVRSSRTVMPPQAVSRYVFSERGYPNLPELFSISTCPVLTPDFELIKTPGYNKATGMYLDVSPIDASKETAREAAAWILDDLLGDFPFANASSRANTLALMLMGLIRPAIQGPAPAFLITAPVLGSGKSILGTCALIPAYRQVNYCQTPSTDDELRKTFTAALMGGVGHMFFDNLKKVLDSPVLENVITAQYYSDRPLGRSEMIELPVKLTIVLTSNNPSASSDLVRRFLEIRIDPKVPDPSTREGFKRPNIVQYVTANRDIVISKLLCILESWIFSGCKLGNVNIGSFESFSSIVSGILDHAGVDGFNGDKSELAGRADVRGNLLRRLVALWWENKEELAVTTRDLLRILQDHDPELLQDITFEENPVRQAMKLGLAVRGVCDRWFDIELENTPGKNTSGGSGGSTIRVGVTPTSKLNGNARFKLSRSKDNFDTSSGGSGGSGGSYRLIEDDFEKEKVHMAGGRPPLTPTTPTWEENQLGVEPEKFNESGDKSSGVGKNTVPLTPTDIFTRESKGGDEEDGLVW